MGGLVSEARGLSAALPAEELDARALTALKGLVAAAVALREHSGFLTRALRFLPQEINRQILPDGCHAERSPAAQLSALQDLTEVRALFQTSQTQPPPALAHAIERMAPALRMMRHGDGALALFNGSKEETATLVDLVLTQAGRGGRGPSALTEGGFSRMQAGRSVLIVDCGAPAPPGLDRLAAPGTVRLKSGPFWRLRADGARLTLDETIYLGGTEPRRGEQIVLTGFADGPQHIKWALSKV